MRARDRIEQYQLEPHPEGGFYKRTYCSSEVFPGDINVDPFPAGRPHSTAIFYLLEAGDFAAFHRIKSDELWHFHDGGALEIFVLQADGPAQHFMLGPAHLLQLVVPKNSWFAAAPATETEYALVSCTVSPGFHFKDHEMATQAELLANYPQDKSIIERFCRG